MKSYLPVVYNDPLHSLAVMQERYFSDVALGWEVNIFQEPSRRFKKCKIYSTVKKF